MCTCGCLSLSVINLFEHMRTVVVAAAAAVVVVVAVVPVAYC